MGFSCSETVHMFDDEKSFVCRCGMTKAADCNKTTAAQPLVDRGVQMSFQGRRILDLERENTVLKTDVMHWKQSWEEAAEDRERVTQENADLKARVETLENFLKQIAESPHQAYNSHLPYVSEYQSGYSVGVADGHRCAAGAAKEALHSPPMREGRDSNG